MHTSRIARFVANLCLPLAISLLVFPLHGDDGAASVGAGGVVLRREARISMKKERLTIGMRKVSVDFDFLNESDQNISTDVAFPIPPYNESPTLGMERLPNFPDFKVWVDGNEVTYKTELKASLRGKDYSALLQKMGINIETFGDFEVYDGTKQRPNQISKLTDAQRTQLLTAGIIERETGERYIPHWTVTKIYYWKQEFPAGRSVHIKHEYTPAAGAAEIPYENFDKKTRDLAIQGSKSGSAGADAAQWTADMVRQGCVDQALQKRLSSGTASGFVFVDYVDYILTSANTWKTPIKDFELVVDYSNAWSGSKDPVLPSLCWDGPIERVDNTHLLVKQRDFVPRMN
jgi:hypothetical protein